MSTLNEAAPGWLRRSAASLRKRGTIEEKPERIKMKINTPKKLAMKEWYLGFMMFNALAYGVMSLFAVSLIWLSILNGKYCVK
ncbi:hypothetical protein D9M68_916570 [compost metagenome]